MPTFSTTHASTIGHSHRKMGYNNQDAVRVVGQPSGVIIAVVADGCGSKPFSEVGSNLAVNFLAGEIGRRIGAGKAWREDLQAAHRAWAEGLIAAQKVEKREVFIHDYLLYTLLGFVVEGEETTVFHCGDGVIMVNGELRILDQQNRPKYINYELSGRENPVLNMEVLPTAGIESLLVGTDGVEDLHETLVKEGWGGYRSLVGVNEAPVMYTDAAALPRLLFEASEAGKLYDDTTIAMMRREW